MRVETMNTRGIRNGASREAIKHSFTVKKLIFLSSCLHFIIPAASTAGNQVRLRSNTRRGTRDKRRGNNIVPRISVRDRSDAPRNSIYRNGTEELTMRAAKVRTRNAEVLLLAVVVRERGVRVILTEGR